MVSGGFLVKSDRESDSIEFKWLRKNRISSKIFRAFGCILIFEIVMGLAKRCDNWHFWWNKKLSCVLSCGDEPNHPAQIFQARFQF